MDNEHINDHVEQLPQEILEAGHKRIAGMLIINGEIEPGDNEYRLPDEPNSWRFILNIPREVVEKYTADYDKTVVINSADCMYQTPARISEDPNDGPVTDVLVLVRGTVPALDNSTDSINSSLEVTQYFHIIREDSTGWRGYSYVEYSKDGYVVGRPQIKQDTSFPESDPRRYGELLDVLSNEQRPLSGGELERMIAVVEAAVRQEC